MTKSKIVSAPVAAATAPRVFSSDIRKLLLELKSCDDADIRDLTADENLDHNWGVDAVRKLAKWDIPGYLSAKAYAVLSTLGHDHIGYGPYTVEYIAVLCDQGENNDTWSTEYACDLAPVLQHMGTVKFTIAADLVYGRYFNKETKTLFCVPLFSEGCNSYLFFVVKPKA